MMQKKTMPLLKKKATRTKRLPVRYKNASKTHMNGPITQVPSGSILQKEMKQCTNELYSKLLHLKHIGILNLSLRPSFTLLYDQSAQSTIHSRPSQSLNENNFQVLEFYGDSVLQHCISRMLCNTRSFMNPHLLTQLRICCVCNENLSSVYDSLHLKTLIPYQELLKELELNPPPPVGSTDKMDGLKRYHTTGRDKIKAKADIVEALIGELSKVIEQEPSSVLPQVVTHCRAALDELMSFIYSSGDLKFYSKYYSITTPSTPPSPPKTDIPIPFIITPSATSSVTPVNNQAAKPILYSSSPTNAASANSHMKKVHQPKKPPMQKPSAQISDPKTMLQTSTTLKFNGLLSPLQLLANKK